MRIVTPAEAVAGIRSGNLDGLWADVFAVVEAAVADELAVANPGYAD